MSKEFKSQKYQGVYWRELVNGDKQYFLRIRRFGRVCRIPIGRESEGCKEEFCAFKYRAYLESQKFLNEVVDPQNYVEELDWDFEKIFNFYLENRPLRESTRRSLQILYQVPFLKSKRVTREQLQRYFNDLLKVKSPTTVKLRFRQIRTIFRFAIHREKYRFPDPTLGIDLPKASIARQRYLTPHEVKLLLQTVKKKSQLYLFVKLALCTGARLGTLITVRRKDVHEDRSIDLYNYKCQRWYKGFLDEETMTLIENRKGFLFAKNAKARTPPKAASIQNRLQRVLNRLFNTSNTPRERRVVVHTLRHSVATQQISKGVPLEVVAKTLDHHSVQVTSLIYAKVAPELVRNAVTDLWELDDER